jgi:hypothetical protein
MVQGYTVHEVHYFIKKCFGCEFYRHRMVMSGRNPEYRNACTNPQAVIDAFGKFTSLDDREIRRDESPEWCPIGERQDGETG